MNDFKENAVRKDQEDELRGFRDRFVTDDTGLIYLDGNSLGKLPKAAMAIQEKTVQHEWGERLIRSWNDDWYTKNMALGKKVGQIVGADEGEVVVTDTTSVNLYKLAHAALSRNKGRTRVVSDALNFPSDLYILQGLVKELGGDYELLIVPSRDGLRIATEDLMAAVDEDTALVSLSHVAFKSSFRYDMEEVTRKVQEKGAFMLWDLCHSAGAVPVELKKCRADFAVGCTYKYLNGGPGAPAFLYVKTDLQQKLVSPIWGWFGEQNPFDFDLNYRPGEGIRRFLAGTPPVLSLKAIEPGLDLMIEAGMDRIWEKSKGLIVFLYELAEAYLYPLGFENGSPQDASERGSHVSFKHPEAYRICKALIDEKVGEAVVIPDFRSPDNIRIGITPLYTSYMDVYLAVMEMKAIVEEHWYDHYSQEKEAVT